MDAPTTAFAAVGVSTLRRIEQQSSPKRFQQIEQLISFRNQTGMFFAELTPRTKSTIPCCFGFLFSNPRKACMDVMKSGSDLLFRELMF